MSFSSRIESRSFQLLIDRITENVRTRTSERVYPPCTSLGRIPCIETRSSKKKFHRERSLETDLRAVRNSDQSEKICGLLLRNRIQCIDNKRRQRATNRRSYLCCVEEKFVALNAIPASVATSRARCTKTSARIRTALALPE